MLWTNRGAFLLLQLFTRGTSPATTFYLALVDSSVAPTVDINTLSQLGEIPAGNGYTSGGIAVARNNTDFDAMTEDDATDKAYAQIKDLVWTASGGTLPGSGSGARYAVLLTDEGTVANRQVIAAWDLGSNVIVSSGQTLTLQNLQLDGLTT